MHVLVAQNGLHLGAKGRCTPETRHLRNVEAKINMQGKDTDYQHPTAQTSQEHIGARNSRSKDLRKKSEIAYIETCNNVNTQRETIRRMQITKFCKSSRRHLYKLENRDAVVVIVFGYERH